MAKRTPQPTNTPRERAFLVGVELYKQKSFLSLEDSLTAFEQGITDTLLAIDPNGLFTEPVTLEVLTATRG